MSAVKKAKVGKPGSKQCGTPRNERKKGNGHTVPCGLSEHGRGGKRKYKNVSVDRSIGSTKSHTVSGLQHSPDHPLQEEGAKLAVQSCSPHKRCDMEASFLVQSHKAGLLSTETLLAAAAGPITNDSPLYDDKLMSKTLHCVSLQYHLDRTKLNVPWYHSFVARVNALSKPADGHDGYFAYDRVLEEEKATACEYLRQSGSVTTAHPEYTKLS